MDDAACDQDSLLLKAEETASAVAGGNAALRRHCRHDRSSIRRSPRPRPEELLPAPHVDACCRRQRREDSVTGSLQRLHDLRAGRRRAARQHAGLGDRRIDEQSAGRRRAAMWWPKNQWYEAHVSAGATTTGTRWASPKARSSPTPSTAKPYILIANTSDHGRHRNRDAARRGRQSRDDHR